jgi:hypothetical protein
MSEGTEETQNKIVRNIQLSSEVGAKMRNLLEAKGEEGFNKLFEAEAENQKLKEELAKAGGIGTLPSSLNKSSEGGSGNSGNREYEGATMQEAYANMIDDLRAKGETETLNKLLQKGIGVFKTNFEVKAPIVTDSKGNVIDSPIRRALNAQNKRARSS